MPKVPSDVFKDHVPADYAVFMSYDGGQPTRLGNAHHVVKARAMIDDNEKAMRQTFGGLVSADGKSRRYAIYKAKGWERIES